MTIPSDPTPEPFLFDFDRVAEEHGEDAKIYAEVRADAASKRGAKGDAKRWSDLAQKLASDQDS